MASYPVRKEIDEDRAAVLLGLTRAQLRELCEESGLEHGEAGEVPQPRSFTYEELYRIYRKVTRPAI
jgi:hypothetical protein